MKYLTSFFIVQTVKELIQLHNCKAKVHLILPLFLNRELFSSTFQNLQTKNQFAYKIIAYKLVYSFISKKNRCLLVFIKHITHKWKHSV